jgi:triphosphoribosyl-dephospho-CoA synthase
MKAHLMTHAEQAQLAMMLEVTAFPKPGNVDRCHDYENTRLEHFLASAILARPAFEHAEQGMGGIGERIREAVYLTNTHSGGNTHFGAFILLIPLIMGENIPGALRVTGETTVEDAIAFYQAFQETEVRILPGDEIDVNSPDALDTLRGRDMTLRDVMSHSATNDMVAREWINGFSLTRKGADLLISHGPGRDAIVFAFLSLLASEPDTFIGKKWGTGVAVRTMMHAREVLEGTREITAFDDECIASGVNPGSIADIIIASIYIALGEGWQWDC